MTQLIHDQALHAIEARDPFKQGKQPLWPKRTGVLVLPGRSDGTEYAYSDCPLRSLFREEDSLRRASRHRERKHRP